VLLIVVLVGNGLLFEEELRHDTVNMSAAINITAIASRKRFFPAKFGILLSQIV
jgi:hypothetical protein